MQQQPGLLRAARPGSRGALAFTACLSTAEDLSRGPACQMGTQFARVYLLICPQLCQRIRQEPLARRWVFPGGIKGRDSRPRVSVSCLLGRAWYCFVAMLAVAPTIRVSSSVP